MARVDFINQLNALGYTTQELSHNVIAVDFTVPIGKNKGKKALLGFPVGNDFPMNCPVGLHFKSVEEGWQEPVQNVSDSPLGLGWRYWSRKFPEWNKTDKTVKTFMTHVRNILTRI